MSQNSDFKIVLFHDDVVSGRRGSSVLERLAGQLDMESDKLVANIWNFALLRQAEVRSWAGLRIMEADMIIMSAANRVDLPAHIKNWFENVLSLRPEREGALVALLDWEQSANGELRLGIYLHELAAKFGMDFFCNQGEWQPPVKRVKDAAAPGTDDRFANPKATVSWDPGRLGWGIND